MNRKLLAVLALIALVVGACGVVGTPSGTLGPLSGEIRISGWSSSPTEDALLTESINAFMAANPTVKVKWEPIAQDYETVLKTNLAAGTEADVFYADIFWIDSVMKTGKLLALDDYMSKTGTSKNDFVPALINAFSYQGKTYGIPKDFNTLGLVYNKDLFKAANVAEPTNDWSWDDLKNAAKKLTTGGVVGLSLPADAARFMPFLWAAGGDLANINNDKGQAAVDFYTGFQAKDNVSKLPSELGMGWAGEAFEKGKAAMVFEGGWLPADLNKNFKNVNYGVVQLPKGSAGKSNLIFTVSYSISAKSKNPSAAWALTNYLTGKDNQSKVLKAGFALPTRTALSGEITDKNSKAIFDGAPYGKPFNYASANTGKVNDEINKALESIMLKKSSVKEALDKLATTIKPLLQ
ncbi:MAG TPA: ABC transporter substrate-binding protein [Candidatus Limnocylindria bacterium]|jgi:multiple sugar transport system substrate-binding protein|nr:ABC transporter substrate-binding protein [Candidatus Limnocylindria bacterium]